MNPPLPTTIDEVCATLTDRGYPDLARRVAYFASDEDLEEGDVPLTFESACGFLELFAGVEWSCQLGLACSPEGWLVGEWRFPDQRRASVWFIDAERVMFTAKNKNGDFVVAGGEGNLTDGPTLAKALVQEGLFSWRLHQARA